MHLNVFFEQLDKLRPYLVKMLLSRRNTIVIQDLSQDAGVRYVRIVTNRRSQLHVTEDCMHGPAVQRIVDFGRVQQGSVDVENYGVHYSILHGECLIKNPAVKCIAIKRPDWRAS